MNRSTVAQHRKIENFFQPSQGLLQRKCACGSHTPGGGKCADCADKEKLNQPLQTKLQIGEANDSYEQEADRVADQVMAMSGHSVVSAAAPRIQRLTRQPIGQSRCSTHSVDRVLASSGRPLEPALRQDMEQRFSYDFSRVQVHTGAAAQQSARDVNAHAYTVGRNIVFGMDRFSPGTHEGRRLIAHELTHVVQQRGGHSNTIQRVHVCENDPTTAPAMGCDIATSTPLGPSLDVLFTVGDDSLSASDTAALQNLVQNWHLAGGTDVVRVDGFASCDGSPSTNWPLSCERALVVAHELLHPSNPALQGIDPAFVDMFANGETDQFSTGLGPNRVTKVALLAAPPPPVPATGAVFSESAAQRFAGYDDSVTPNFQVVPLGERRIADVTITPAGATPTFVSNNSATAAVSATATGIETTGVADGSTTIEARQGATVLDTLRTDVKDQRSITVDYHFMSDTARPAFLFFPARPSHATTRAVGSVPAMTATLNRIWQRQANVLHTTGTIDSPTIPGNLGAQIIGPNSASPELRQVVAHGTGGDWNVFLVWEFEMVASAGTDAANAGTNGDDTLLEDNECADALTISHEAGHFLSGASLPHTTAGIMGGCGAPNRRRVRKAEADAANP